MKHLPKAQIMTLVNHDGLLCTKPFRNKLEERQYYGRFVDRMLWYTFTAEDWKTLQRIVDTLRVDEKLKRTTRFLLQRRGVGQKNS
jgi:hypothetical protein